MIIQFGWVVLILWSFLETQSLSNFLWFVQDIINIICWYEEYLYQVGKHTKFQPYLVDYIMHLHWGHTIFGDSLFFARQIIFDEFNDLVFDHCGFALEHGGQATHDCCPSLCQLLWGITNLQKWDTESRKETEKSRKEKEHEWEKESRKEKKRAGTIGDVCKIFLFSPFEWCQLSFTHIGT